MKRTQYEAIGALLKRKRGATVAELIAATMTCSPHRRMYEMRRKGWAIWREAIPGKNYGRYFGKAPA
jgi:hypothetical protein